MALWVGDKIGGRDDGDDKLQNGEQEKNACIKSSGGGDVMMVSVSACYCCVNR